jgi:hypothetical protein
MQIGTTENPGEIKSNRCSMPSKQARIVTSKYDPSYLHQEQQPPLLLVMRSRMLTKELNEEERASISQCFAAA